MVAGRLGLKKDFKKGGSRGGWTTTYISFYQGSKRFGINLLAERGWVSKNLIQGPSLEGHVFTNPLQ